MHEIEVWVMIDSDGDYAVAKTEDDACELFESDTGGSGARRLVKLTVKVPLPKPLEATGVVVEPDERAEIAAA